MEQAKLLHPDKNGAAEAKESFQALGKAYITLSNPSSREVYDWEIGHCSESTDKREEAKVQVTKYRELADIWQLPKHYQVPHLDFSHWQTFGSCQLPHLHFSYLAAAKTLPTASFAFLEHAKTLPTFWQAFGSCQNTANRRSCW